MSGSVQEVSGSSEQDVSLRRWLIADRHNIMGDAIAFGGLLLLYSSVTACFVSTFSEVWQLQLLSVVATAIKVLADTSWRYCSQYRHGKIQVFCSILGATALVAVDFLTRRILTHELGHFLSHLLLTDHIHTAPIIICPFPPSGSTTFCIGDLNIIGWLLGHRWTFIITVASGPLASCVVALLLLAYSHFQEDRNLKMCAIATWLSSLCGEIWYAFTGVKLLEKFFLFKQSVLSKLLSLPEIAELAKSKEMIITGAGHDFLLLAQFGYHPLACMAAMIIVPICLMAYLQKHYPRGNRHTLSPETQYV